MADNKLMMTRLNSIHIKIIATVVIICSILALSIGGVLFLYDNITHRQLMEKDLTTKVNMLSINLITPLLFSDPQAASEILSSTKANVHILHAWLYDAQKAKFASYDNPQTQTKPAPKHFQQQITYNSETIFLVHPIQHRSEIVGYIYLESSLMPLIERRSQYIQVVILTLFATIAIAILLSLALLRSIIKPIESLTVAAAQVVKGDYSQRVAVPTKDEIGLLASTFNAMLDKLEKSTVSRNYLETIIQSMKDSLLVLSPQGNIQKVNRAGQVMFASDEQSLIGVSITDILIEPEKDAVPKLFHESVIKTLSETGGINSIETYYKTQSGNLLPISLSVTVMHDEQRKIQGIVCVVQDLSEQQKAEKEITHSNQKLTLANQELLQTQSQLIQSAKLASVGELATGIAHELNQPLSIISMGADLKLLQVKDGEIEDPDNYFELVLKQVERATTIINHLRTFGRESNKMARMPVAINQIIEDSFIMLNEQLRLHDITVVKDITVDSPQVHCNAIQIEQVLTNLIVNAKDALETASIKKITIKTSRVDNNAIIEIGDTGSGISAVNMERIFDPFFTTKEVGKGTGLGLSISYGIVQDHGGSLTVSSILQEGTTFRIELPTVEQTSVC